MRGQFRCRDVRRVVFGMHTTNRRQRDVRRNEVRGQLPEWAEGLRGNLHSRAGYVRPSVPGDDARLLGRLRGERQREFVRRVVFALRCPQQRAGDLRRGHLRDSMQPHVQGLRKPMHTRDGLLPDSGMSNGGNMLRQPMSVQLWLQIVQGGVHLGKRVLHR